jgi:iron(III) transport system ATP-binding protein
VIGHERQVGEPGADVLFAAAPNGAEVSARRAEPPGTQRSVSVRLEDLRKSFGACAAVDGVTLDVHDGELLAILGPSGCGKSTLLRLVAGLERQDRGRVVLHGRDVGQLPPAARGCGVVFQSYALFPNLTAAANVAFGIDRRRHGRKARAERARALLEQVGLTDAADRYPPQLSGGQQQRVALARALATEPSLLLLDEPLSALDAKVRAMLRVEIRRLQQATRLTTLLVTHDQEEAMTMADRVAVMNGGRLVQVDEPRGVYQRPADAFTAAFVGVMNFLEGWMVGPGRTLRKDGMVLRTSEEPPAAAGARVTVAFRPEEAALGGRTPSTGENVLPCRVERVEFRGAFVRYYLALAPSSDTPGAGGGDGIRAYERNAPSRANLRSESVLLDVPERDAAHSDAQPGVMVDLHVAPESIRVFRDVEAAR